MFSQATYRLHDDASRSRARNGQSTGHSIAPMQLRTNESPGVSLLRHFLFPACAVIALLFVAALFEQRFTRPYVILATLAYALTWRLLGAAEFRECGASKATFHALWAPQLWWKWANVFAILLFIAFLTKVSAVYSRAIVITWAIITPIFFSVGREVAYRALCHWNKTRRIARTHVVVGTNEAAREFASRLEADSSLGTFIGFFDLEFDPRERRDRNDVVLGGIEDLPEYVRRNAIDVVHIALPASEAGRLETALEKLRDTTASIYFLPDIPRCMPNQMHVVEMAGTPLLLYFETPHCGLEGVAKRAIDLAFSGLLIALLWPALLAIAIAIHLDSHGPIIFKQRRYGLNGEEIAVYKFRTMSVCEDGGTVAQATRDDPRITRVGGFLRRTSLDELPQLFCVLTGSMSLVGPRPHAVAHNEMYRRLIDGYMLRHKVRPGITGWAQVNGLRGETNTVDRMRERVAYDLDYLRNWSPWIDIMILWRTIWVVFYDRNAY